MGNAATKDASTQFIESESKWVRVLAGPGTGKSYNLKERLKYLVNTKGIKPEKILVLTFTSVAVEDLKQDIKKLGLGNIKVSTLHAHAIAMLLRKGKKIRLMLDFEVDTMLRDLELEIDKSYDQESLLKKRVNRDPSTEQTEQEIQFENSLHNWLQQHNGDLLDDLIPDANSILKETNSRHRRFEWILVDEYQDLNPAEQEFVELLLSANGHLMVIGDDDQSIYEFKGASPDGIRTFLERHKNEADECEDISFSQCYRCPACVVELANRLIKKSQGTGRSEKELTALPENQPGSCEVLLFQTPSQEINELCKKIVIERGVGTYGDIVVLCRDKSRARVLYNALQAAGVPVALCFRGHMFDSKVIRESYSLLSLVADSNDLVSWRYLFGEELDGEAAKKCAEAYQDIRKYAADENRGILDVLKGYDLTQVEDEKLALLLNRFNTINEKIQETEKEIKTDRKKYIDRFRAREPQYADLLQRAFDENITQKTRKVSLKKFRDYLRSELFSPEAARADGRVRIMSLHAAKGLSAPMIIIMSATDELIDQNGESSLEENRRLFYVAITRCKGSKNQFPGKLVISSYCNSDNLKKAYSLTEFVLEMTKPEPPKS